MGRETILNTEESFWEMSGAHTNSLTDIQVSAC